MRVGCTFVLTGDCCDPRRLEGVTAFSKMRNILWFCSKRTIVFEESFKRGAWNIYSEKMPSAADLSQEIVLNVIEKSAGHREY